MVSKSFEAYRTNTQPFSVPRLIIGTVLILLIWFGIGVAIVLLALATNIAEKLPWDENEFILAAVFISFPGIWIGIWLVMRFLHRQPLTKLFGIEGKIAWGDYARAFIATIVWLLIAEALMYLLFQDLERTERQRAAWFFSFIPLMAVLFIQTSAEELLFRGYLMRGIASRFRSPWLWILIPSVSFIALHYSPDLSLASLFIVAIDITAFTTLAVVVTYATGNLGAALGCHMANNLFVGLVISHESELSGLALFRGVQLDQPDLSSTVLIAFPVLSVLFIAVQTLMLLHPKSPLRLTGYIRTAPTVAAMADGA
ncbi:type II CAAX endopeptidase family protein [Phyllobacterium sp. SB3]|uniref:CPBP family intramembrane glutamic endopeptidase n=1 Tax=Phyllobacterium sp. SB3 TaxID=3156073 RepID=UPI0032AE8DF6